MNNDCKDRRSEIDLKPVKKLVKLLLVVHSVKSGKDIFDCHGRGKKGPQKYLSNII